MKSLAFILALTGFAIAQQTPVFTPAGSNGENVVQSPFIAALGGTTAGKSLFQLANPSAIRFPRINADNTATLLSDADFRTAIGAGTGSGDVTLTGAQTLTNKTLTAPVLTAPALGTPASGNFSSGTFTWPTFNQSTSGNAATATLASTVTTNANLTGDVTSVGNAATVGKINGVSLAGLGTGIMKNTTGTGAPSIAVAGDFPTLNQSTTGSAATLTTPRTIAGVSFDGSANISITAANVGAVATSGNETVAGNKTLSGQLQLTGQAATDANSAITKGLLPLQAAENVWWDVTFNPTVVVSGTGASATGRTMAFSGGLSTSASAGAYVLSSTDNDFSPTDRHGSGASMRISDSNFTFLWRLQEATISNAEIRLLFGVANTKTELDVAGIGVVLYVDSGTYKAKLQVHNGTTLTESSGYAYTPYYINGLKEWMLVFKDGVYNLYFRGATDTAALGSWNLAATLTGSGMPNVASGKCVNIVNMATGTPATTSKMVLYGMKFSQKSIDL